MTRRRLQLAAAVVFVLGLVGASIALASGGDKGHGKHGKGNFRANLIGFQEVPVVNTTGHAKLRLSLTDTEITFQLDYADLSGPPLFAHIHAGQRSVKAASQCSSAAAEASRRARARRLGRSVERSTRAT
jgi:hypothetical protein